jgi:hypothetical protein
MLPAIADSVPSRAAANQLAPLSTANAAPAVTKNPMPLPGRREHRNPGKVENHLQHGRTVTPSQKPHAPLAGRVGNDP